MKDNRSNRVCHDGMIDMVRLPLLVAWGGTGYPFINEEETLLFAGR